MSWQAILGQQIINGLTIGVIYALIALGYTMVYGILQLINFAHGEVFMVGAYSAYAYEATNLALSAIRAAGQPDRSAVLAAMQTLKEFPGILGVHTFDAHGDTRNRTIGIFMVHNGRFEFVTSVSPP